MHTHSRMIRGLHRPAFLVLLACVQAYVAVTGVGASDTGAQEEAALRKAAGEYFNAEQERDSARVWDLIAPSSVFKRQASYELYLQLLKDNPIRVTSFIVEDVIDISQNTDRERMPAVEMIGLVRVKVRLTSERGKESEHTSIFTFLKEDGKWLKG